MSNEPPGVFTRLSDIRWCTRKVREASPNWGGGVREVQRPVLQQAWRDCQTGVIEWRDVPTMYEPTP